MNRTTARWTIAIAAAAVLAMPVSGLAQTPPPAQPPAAEPAPAAPPPAQGASQEAAKAHLTAARNTLSQLTQLPAAAQLQGESRTHVSQLIKNFNELITTQAAWKASYAKVEANLAALLSPQQPGADPARAGTAEIDPAIRTKLIEFRSHLDKFEEAASGAATDPAPAPTAATTTSTTTTTMQTPPQTPPMTTPTSQTPPTTQTPPATQPPTTQTPPDPPPPDAPSPTARPDQEPIARNPEELLRHVEAIEVILAAQAAAQATAQTAAGGAVGTSGTVSGSTRTTITGSDVTLNQAQLQQLRSHLAELRRLIGAR
jgi:hypothetical protein